MVKRIDKLNESQIIFGGTNLIAFVVVILLAYQGKLYSDDLCLLDKVNSFNGNLFQNAYDYAFNYHMTWGGRSVAAFVMAIFIKINKIIFDITDAFIYIVFANLLYFFAYSRKSLKHERHTGLLILIYCILWFTIPTFGQIVIWLTGSIAYFWLGTVQLALILYFFKRAFSDNIRRYNYSILTICSLVLGFLMIGFLSGCASEPSSCMMVVSVLAWLFYMKYQKKIIYSFDYFAILGVFMGFLFLFTAPGIYIRANAANETGSFLILLLYRFIRQTYYVAKYLTIPLAFTLVPTFRDKEKYTFKEYIKAEKEQLVLIAMAFFNVYIMVLSPGSAVRIFFTSVMLIVAAMAVSYRKHLEGRYKLSLFVFIVLFMLLTAVSIFTGAISCHRTGKPLEMQMDYNSENIGQLL